MCHPNPYLESPWRHRILYSPVIGTGSEADIRDQGQTPDGLRMTRVGLDCVVALPELDCVISRALCTVHGNPMRTNAGVISRKKCEHTGQELVWIDSNNGPYGLSVAEEFVS